MIRPNDGQKTREIAGKNGKRMNESMNASRKGAFGARLMVAVGTLVWATGAFAQGDTAKAAPATPAAVAADLSDDAAAPAAPASASEELDNLKGKVEGLNESFLETKATVDKLAKIKVSGYIQAQFQMADSATATNNVVGGSWTPGGTDQRLNVRRGRVKTTYETATSRYLLQIDVVPTGVSLKDANVTLMEPWLKAFTATAGVFDRPFGFEISYSSSSRESPERSRVFQTLFPGERDLGAKLEFNPPSEWGFASNLNLKGGLFTGMGGNAAEIDRELDWISRAGLQLPFYDLNLSIDGGYSTYMGGAVAATDSLFKPMQDSVSKYSVTTAGTRNSIQDRVVHGVDAQIYYDLPVLGGFSLRGEYLWGTIPGTRSASGPYAAATSAMVLRDVAGWYVTWVQNLGKRFQAVVKYDVYDPNTEVEGDEVFRAGSNLNAADLAFNTLGLGLLFHWDENVRLTAYYDMIENETVNAAATGSNAAWGKDLNDNVLTLRAQVKF